MSYLIGRGRTARETYPEAPRSSGGGGTGSSCPPAVVFDPNPPCTPTTNIRSARSANQSPIAEPVVGATNLGSDTSGTSVGVTGNYATVLGGDQNTATADYATVAGGSENKAGGETSTIGGGFGNSALGGNSAISGGERNISSGSSSSVAGGNDSIIAGDGAAMAGGEGNTAFGEQAAVAGSSNNASGNNSVVGGGTENSAGYPPVTFTVSAGGTLVTIAGDVTAQFLNGSTVAVQPRTPQLTASNTSLSVASVPVFGGVNTTFDLSGSIDGTTTDGLIADTAIGQISTIGGGQGNLTTGNGATIPGGLLNTATGDNSIAEGAGAFAYLPTQRALCGGGGGSGAAINGSAATVPQTSELTMIGTANSEAAFQLGIGGGGGSLPLLAGKAYHVNVSTISVDQSSPPNTRAINILASVHVAAGPTVAVDGVSAATSAGSGATAADAVSFAAVGGDLLIEYTSSVAAGGNLVQITARVELTEVAQVP